MGESREQPIVVEETKEQILPENPIVDHQSRVSRLARYKWWLSMVIFTFLVLSGQSVAILMGRLYFEKGGKSKWMATLVQTVAYPILLPILYLSRTKNNIEQNLNNSTTKNPSLLILVSVYLVLGLILASISLLYSIGLSNLPVSTFSLINASQLAFNSFFSYFLNKQKFTPSIVNSLFLLTISSVLLVLQTGSGDSSKTSKRKYAIGFICTVAGSAGTGLLLALTQFTFRKILKKNTMRVVFEMLICECLVATFATLIGFFVSGDWKSIKGEMEEFELGRVSYVMNLVWTAVAWQVFSIGYVGLIFQVSALFSNVISILGVPIIPVLAVVFFHDKMSGAKVIAMLLAIWGFCSYMYQHYLDDLELKRAESINVTEVSMTERV